MGDYWIKVNIVIGDDSGETDSSTINMENLLPEQDACSIDAVEQAMLSINRQAIKEAVAKHLETVSKNKAQSIRDENGGIIEENVQVYRVDGEIGRITFKTHRVRLNGKVVFDTSKHIFRILGGTEWYRTEGFNEIAFGLAIDMSLRKAGKMLNRVRGEVVNGTPIRTLANLVEIEGREIQEDIDRLSAATLKDNGFTVEGKLIDDDREYGIELGSVLIPKPSVIGAIEEYNEGRKDSEKIDVDWADKVYEEGDKAVNISLDEVGVNKQKETGRSAAKEKKEQREYVENTVGHVEHSGRRYILTARSIVAIIPLIVAFLFHNGLLRHRIQFFVDGARNLQNAILRRFSWLKSYGMILDWYHLRKKCKLELSLVMRNSELRNSILTQILPLLWLGKIDAAIKVLRNVNMNHRKTGRTTEKLVGYFERNRKYIPCYALRKKLGLRNSSNKGEKANDLAVSNRQKHNGMSWSTEGSPALATITALHLNNEEKNWYRHNRVTFKLLRDEEAA